MRIHSKRRVRLRLVARQRLDPLAALEKVEDAVRPVPGAASEPGDATRPRVSGHVTDEILEAQALDRGRRRLEGKSHRPPVQELQQTIPHEEQARMLERHLERRTFLGIRRLAADCVRTRRAGTSESS